MPREDLVGKQFTDDGIRWQIDKVYKDPDYKCMMVEYHDVEDGDHETSSLSEVLGWLANSGDAPPTDAPTAAAAAVAAGAAGDAATAAASAASVRASKRAAAGAAEPSAAKRRRGR